LRQLPRHAVHVAWQNALRPLCGETVHVKDHTFLESVILVEAVDLYNMSRVNTGRSEAFLETPTFTGVPFMAVLPEDSR
jgi:hypothetical protein